ncbi:MAG: adenylosuccinate lyase [Bacteroidales bacterium]|nr:adenylosuccinate lyase [Bacteroidales bacterium]
MDLNALTAVSPVDGRYRSKIEELSPYFSEYGLMKYRVRVEIEYFIALCRYKLPQLETVPKDAYQDLPTIYLNFSEEDAAEIKEIEKTTNHDVKAVEYFIKRRFENLQLDTFKEFIHFGLTSQDINNTAVPLSYKEALKEVFYPLLQELIDTLINLSVEWEEVPLLARTHGQPASPTLLGKEIRVFIERLKTQLAQLQQIPVSAKFGGATGNFNAHHVTYPEIDWAEFGNAFVDHILGLNRLQTTTQIEHYDNLAASFQAIGRINTILTDLSRDIWTYISMDYFKQKIKKGEIGSSAMPHKVNPIDFENAEGNLGVANAFFSHLANKLPISRLQRDLTDSTVLRNIGVPLAHSLIAYKSMLKGLGKLLLNQDKMNADLEANWSVVAEAIQTILRREAYPNPYEALLSLTRTNEKMTRERIASFIDSLEVSEGIKQELKNIKPSNYTGIRK